MSHASLYLGIMQLAQRWFNFYTSFLFGVDVLVLVILVVLGIGDEPCLTLPWNHPIYCSWRKGGYASSKMVIGDVMVLDFLVPLMLLVIILVTIMVMSHASLYLGIILYTAVGAKVVEPIQCIMQTLKC